MSPLRGIFLTVTSMALFALADTCIKFLVPAVPVSMVVGITAMATGIGFAIISISQRKAFWSRDFFNKTIILRNIGEVFGSVMFTLALALTPLSTASAIQQALPLAVTLGAVLFLGETVGWRRWSAMGIGFIGVLLVIKLGTSNFDPLSVFAALSVVGFTLRDLMTPRVPKSVSTTTLAGYAFCLLGITGFVMAIVQGQFAPPPVNFAPLLALMSALVLAGVFAMTTALRIAPVSVVIPFRYTRIVFAMIIGVFFLGETPDVLTYVGSALIVSAGLYSVWREAKLARALPFGQSPR